MPTDENSHRSRGVTRLDGVRGKKQVWRPMFEPEVFRKQIYYIEERACDIVETSAPGDFCFHSLRPCIEAHILHHSNAYT